VSVSETQEARSLRPTSERAHTQSHYVFRCYAYGPEPGLYLAECVDLDIVAQGRTVEEAAEKLTVAIQGYLAVALNGDTKGLVPRRSPISNRLRYRWYRAIAWLERNVGFRQRPQFRWFDFPKSAVLPGVERPATL
jgi:predicted RNase H-like HicB family nuclease